MRRHYGFTLVELAVVIIIISVIAGMGLVATLGAVESARRAQTSEKMNVIESALQRFREQNDRLPCPASPALAKSHANYGKELTTSSVCTNNGTSPPYGITGTDGFMTVEGTVPTKTLGIPDEFMFDGWGRKFVYTMDAELGLPYAFTAVSPRATGCGITVRTATAGNTRSNNAIYVLLSYGPNGHGGFVNTTRVSTASTNTDEQTNCHCNASATYSAPGSGAIFVQRDPVDSTSGVAGFDDIVRYKERWQMWSEADAIAAANDSEYQVAFSYVGSSVFHLRRRECHDWANASTSSVTPSSTAYGVVFKSDSKGFVTCYTHTGNVRCTPYSYALGGKTLAAGTVFTPASTATSNGIAFSNNGYLAVAVSTTTAAVPYVKIYKNSGTIYSDVPSPFPSGSTPTQQPTIIKFSRNADYLFMSDQLNYSKIWVRTGDDKFRMVVSSAMPTQVRTACDNDDVNVSGAAFSPDNRYFAVACKNGATPALNLWKIGTGNPLISGGEVVFAAISPGGVTDVIPYDMADVGFSADSRYVVIAASRTGLDIADQIKMYRIDAADTFTPVTVSGSWDYADTTPLLKAPLLFTKDSNFLLVPVTVSGGGISGLAVFRRFSPTEFRYVTNSLVSAAFSGADDMATIDVVTK